MVAAIALALAPARERGGAGVVARAPRDDPAPLPTGSAPPVSRRRERWQQAWRNPAATAAAGAVVGALVGAAGVGLAGFGPAGGTAGPAAGPAGACDAVRVAEQTLPGIVTVQVSGAQGANGTGSGAILDADGHVVTNDHVIAPAAQDGQIVVRLADGEHQPATLVGRDPQTDLAVLRVDRPGLPTVPLADGDGLRIGQPVVALGAPLGLSNTVTTGIVSALDRTVTVPTADGGTTVLTGTVQTDASINPGNSGGALVDCHGRLVGVNTAISTVPNAAGQAGGGSVGIGFAVPAETVRAITDELIRSGFVAHPSFGMATTPLPPAAADRFGVPPGLVVTSVVPGGSADEAGLRPGDLVVRLGDTTAPTGGTVARIQVGASDGDQVEVELMRDGEPVRTTVTLRPVPPG